MLALNLKCGPLIFSELIVILFVKTELYIHNGSTITIKGDSIELHCAFFLHMIYHFISVR